VVRFEKCVASAAKAVDENKPFIAAVNRCATQNQVEHRVFPQPLKPVLFQNNLKLTHYRKLRILSADIKDHSYEIRWSCCSIGNRGPWVPSANPNDSGENQIVCATTITLSKIILVLR
jgi:hypothetical protein